MKSDTEDYQKHGAVPRGIPLPPPLPLLNVPAPPRAAAVPYSHSHDATPKLTIAKPLALIESTFSPRHFFFYGSLMDPEVYQAITRTANLPMMRKAWVVGFKMKMWGIYPALVPETGSKITGTFCMVESYGNFRSVQAYETEKYTPVECTIHTEDGSQLADSLTFGWAGSSESKELEEGVFDFERYQRYFKPSVVRRKPEE